jgi:hypothetical protein
MARTLGQDETGQHEVDDQEQGAQRSRQHEVPQQSCNHSEHGHRGLVHQEQEDAEA